ncbi:MAG: energy-coupling factor transporter transmembrane component T [Bacillota bacterium]
MSRVIVESNENWLRSLDPRTKTFLLLAFLVVGVSILDPFLTLGLLRLVLCLYLVAGIPLKDLAELSKPLIFAFVMFFLLNFPFAKPLPGEKVYFYLIPPRFVPITMTGILTGLSSALRFMMFIWIANLVTSITPTSELLLALNKSKVSPEASIAIGIAFSYIPELQKEFMTIVEAQKCRGAQLEQRNPAKRLIAYIPVIVPALYISILRGQDISRAIEARGFTYNPIHRTYRRDIVMQPADWAMVAVMALLCVVVLYLRYRYHWFDYRFILNLLT